MTFSWRRELPHWAILAAVFAVAAWAWPHMPDRVPVHWNAEGHADGFGGRSEAVLLPSAIVAGAYLLLRFLPVIDPGRENYRSFAGAYDFIRLAIVAAIGAMAVMVALAGAGVMEMRADLTLALVGGLFVALGGAFGKVRPNWGIGFRTPWTLSSLRAWNGTNRLGGWLFVVTGLLTMVTAIVHRAWADRVLMTCVWTSVAVTLVYSWWAWWRDPDKVSPDGIIALDLHSKDDADAGSDEG